MIKGKHTQKHIGMSVAGALRNWKDENFDGAMRDDTGKLLTPAEAKAMLEKLRYEGVELVPCCSSDECPDFDPITGCPGHVIEPENESEHKPRLINQPEKTR